MIVPQLASGGCTPIERNESAASVSTVVAIISGSITITVVTTFVPEPAQVNVELAAFAGANAPTDTSAILELEQLAACEIEVTALPLSAIEELVEKGYRSFSTAVVNRRDNLFVTRRPTRTSPIKIIEGGRLRKDLDASRQDASGSPEEALGGPPPSRPTDRSVTCWA